MNDIKEKYAVSYYVPVFKDNEKGIEMIVLHDYFRTKDKKEDTLGYTDLNVSNYIFENLKLFIMKECYKQKYKRNSNVQFLFEKINYLVEELYYCTIADLDIEKKNQEEINDLSIEICKAYNDFIVRR